MLDSIYKLDHIHKNIEIWYLALAKGDRKLAFVLK